MTREILAALIDAKAREIKLLADLFSIPEKETTIICVEKLRDEFLGSVQSKIEIDSCIRGIFNTKRNLLFSYEVRGEILYQKVMEFTGLCDILYFKLFH